MIHQVLLFPLETTPSNEDQPLYETVSNKLLVPAPDLLAQLKGYTSSDAFKCAIQNATPENEEKAWRTVLPTVDMLRSFYQYTSELRKSSYDSHIHIVLTTNLIYSEGRGQSSEALIGAMPRQYSIRATSWPHQGIGADL